MNRAYAERSKPRDAECPLRKVIFIGPAKSGKAKIRHADADLDGLEEWVPARTLLCPWGERRAFLRDESRRDALRKESLRDYDPVVEEAISAVFEATGEEGGFDLTWRTEIERARRLWRRAGLDGAPDEQPFAYKDRHGTLHLSYETALTFAQAFAAAEPEPCIHTIQEREDHLRAVGYEPGNRHSHSLLRKYRPAHALVREWAQSSELALLQKENQRLRDLLWLAREDLRKLGDGRSADRLERALRGQ